jgi:hypothetical protein
MWDFMEKKVFYVFCMWLHYLFWCSVVDSKDCAVAVWPLCLFTYFYITVPFLESVFHEGDELVTKKAIIGFVDKV